MSHEKQYFINCNQFQYININTEHPYRPQAGRDFLPSPGCLINCFTACWFLVTQEGHFQQAPQLNRWHGLSPEYTLNPINHKPYNQIYGLSPE